MSTTDDEIQLAYGHLDDALSPPADGAERIGRRMTVRRRRRRAALAGTGAVTAAAVVGAVLVLGGGDTGGPDAATDPATPTEERSALVLTRPDGSTYDFGELTVSCEPPMLFGDLSTPPGKRIWMYSQMSFTGTADEADSRLVDPFVTFEGIVSKIQGGRTFELASESASGDSERRPMTLFVADTEGTPRSNEVSSSEAGSAGTVTVLEASCDPTPVLRLEIDATLGSEVEQNTLAVAGVVH